VSRVDFFASESQYLDHVAPVWHALPAPARGEFIVPDALVGRAHARGIEAVSTKGGHEDFGLVASYRDLLLLAPRRSGVILMEHGSGQAYPGRGERHPAYAGGTGRERVSLFLCPNDYSAQLNADAYPDAAVANVGSPWLDWLIGSLDVHEHPKTVALTFHPNLDVCPETRSAWPWWHDTLLSMVLDTGWRVVGTGHPRSLYPELANWYDFNGGGEVIVVPEFTQVCEEADVLIGDNSTALYAWQALDRPVVTLNCPWYDKTVRHGLRFWDAVPGAPCDDPVDLYEALKRADDPRARKRAVSAAWGTVDGRSAVRAAGAITDLL
jgi:hypothetical protein